MEKRATSLEEERLAADAMLQQARAEAEAAAAEMAKVTEARESLQSELGQAMMEKEVALKAALQEQSEREKLEKKLQMAEDSLKRLDAALRKSGVKVDVDIEVRGCLRRRCRWRGFCSWGSDAISGCCCLGLRRPRCASRAQAAVSRRRRDVRASSPFLTAHPINPRLCTSRRPGRRQDAQGLL